MRTRDILAFFLSTLFLVLPLEVTPLAAQDVDENAEPTMPPVVVEPDEELEPDFYEPDYYSHPRNGGSIGWSSNAIQSDTARVGPYGQPQWTTQRPFATTRTYVLPSGTMELEQWVRPTWKDGDVEFRMLEEYAVGLGCRWQLDVYERWNIEPDNSGNHDVNHEGVQIEFRYALADWGVIPLNPTLYGEWVERGGPQEKPNQFELKLLLSDELLCNLYYGSNLILEQEVSGDLETELGWSNAFGTTVIERILLAGVEMVWSGTTVKDNRSNAEESFLIGPSLQWRPTNRTFLDVVGLFGTTDESPEAQMYIVFGYQFGTRAGPTSGYQGAPASSYFMGNGGGGEIRGPASTRGN